MNWAGRTCSIHAQFSCSLLYSCEIWGWCFVGPFVGCCWFNGIQLDNSKQNAMECMNQIWMKANKQLSIDYILTIKVYVYVRLIMTTNKLRIDTWNSYKHTYILEYRYILWKNECQPIYVWANIINALSRVVIFFGFFMGGIIAIFLAGMGNIVEDRTQHIWKKLRNMVTKNRYIVLENANMVEPLIKIIGGSYRSDVPNYDHQIKQQILVLTLQIFS